MKVDIRHVEKTQGLVFKKTFHGVTLAVRFSGEETAIIEERGLKNTMVLERDVPADVNAEKHQKTNIAVKIAKAAMAGDVNANNFHLTIGKLVRGPDTYFFETPLEAKEYEAELREKLPQLKDHLLGNASIEQKSDSFEL